jgi:hypothetical protein
MFKIAVIVWIMLATVMAGVSLLVVVTVPEFSADAARLIPIACGLAALVAIPLSYIIAWRIKAQTAA